MGTTIDGLISGMNTTQIIAQLMQIERLPEQQMAQRQNTAQSLVTILQGLNTKVSSLQTAAQALIPDTITKASVWQSATATTSDPTRVTATAGTGALPGSISFSVTSLATAGAAVSTGTVGSTAAVVASGPILVSKGATSVGFTGFDYNSASGATLRAGAHQITVAALNATDFDVVVDGTHNTVSNSPAGTQITLNGANGDTISATSSGALKAGSATATSVSLAAGAKLSDVVNGINATTSTSGVQAAAVAVSSTAYRLQLASTTTGSASDITVNGGAFAYTDPTTGASLGGTQQLTAGSDTVLHVGTGPGAYDVTSSTTTVKGLLPGVDVTALKADPLTTVTLNVAQDTQGMADKVKAMVDQANSVLQFISSNSTWDPTKKTGGPLMSSSLARSLASQISSAVIGSSTTTASSAGVAVDKDGNITFDQTKFMAAWAKDPASVQSTLTSLGQSISDLAKQASDPIDGLITGQVKSQQQAISDIGKQIDDFEVRMTLRQDSLQRQYASLETALGQLQSQSQWLAGQLGSISANSSSSK